MIPTYLSPFDKGTHINAPNEHTNTRTYYIEFFQRIHLTNNGVEGVKFLVHAKQDMKDTYHSHRVCLAINRYMLLYLLILYHVKC